MRKPVSDLEYKMLKIVSDSEIQMDHLIVTRKPGLEIVNKNKRELATEWKSKKTKREASTYTFPEN